MAQASMRYKQITIYLPSNADVKRWQTLAKGKSSSLSGWVYEMVELALTRPPPRPVTDTEELSHLRKEVYDLKRENEQLLKLNNQLVENYRPKDNSRITQLEEAVKSLMQRGGTMNDMRLRKALETPEEPYLNDIDAVVEQNFEKNLRMEPPHPMALSKAMCNLIDRGLIVEAAGGYQWKGKS